MATPHRARSPPNAPSTDDSSHARPIFSTLGGSFLVEDLAANPGSGVGPVAVRGCPRQAQGLGGLLNAEAGEIAELDQFGRLLVLGGQPIERLVNGEDLVGRRINRKVVVE